MSSARASALYAQKRYSQAEKEYRQFLSANPDDSYSHGMLALCCVYQKKEAEALRESEEAIRLSPDFAWAHYVRSHVLKWLGKNAEAETAIRDAIRLDPEKALYYGELAHVHLRMKKFKESAEAADAGLALEPDHLTCLNYKGWALYAKMKFDDANIIADEILRLKPEQADAHALKGYIHFQRGKKVEAIQQFREALRLDPQLETARDGLLTSLCSRNPLYGVLAAFSWLGQPRIPFFFGYYAIAIVAFYLFFIVCHLVLSAIAPHLLNICMRYDPIAKHALNENEIFAATVLSSWLLAAYMITMILLFTCGLSPIFAPAFFFLYGVPFLLARIFEFPDQRYRRQVIIYSAVAATFGILSICFAVVPEPHGRFASPYDVRLLSLYTAAIFSVMVLFVRTVQVKHAEPYSV